MRVALFAVLVALIAGQAPLRWVPQNSGTTARLRGLSVVSDRIVWASGTGGTVIRTVDGGATWARRPVPGAEALDFRDIEALDDRRAFALSIGPGEASRVYRTDDGGGSWSKVLTNPDEAGFLDALAFWDDRHGLVLGDPVDGRFVILTTDDAGATWTRVAAEAMPPATPGEGAFAASGTCLVVQGTHNAWFGTGAGRIFRTRDRGRTWTVHPTPIRAGGGSAGIFSVAFRDADHGLAVGGDYQQPKLAGQVVALTSDGGQTWRQPKGPEPPGYRSAVTLLGDRRILAAGPTGTDLSTDGGETWTPLGDTGYHAVRLAPEGPAWAVGDEGRIARLAP